MSRTNGLISGDNKGASSRFMEDWAKDNDFLEDFQRMYHDSFEGYSKFRVIPRRVSNIIPQDDEHEELMELPSSFPAFGGKPTPRILSSTKRVRSVFRHGSKLKFVSAFCQSNSADIRPNVLGTFCIDTCLHCDFNISTCDGKNELCYRRGPGYPDEFESTRIIGDRQFRKAIKLFKTYPAALGFSVTARTTDGPGIFDFQQGNDQGNTFWRLARNGLKTPSKKQAECQKPKLNRDAFLSSAIYTSNSDTKDRSACHPQYTGRQDFLCVYAFMRWHFKHISICVHIRAYT
ncbi:Ceramidase [Zostera marina]|uniref:Ceramidase n=1 Tax=Zostera marina TaxID=29655 RepID=A0A0K9NH64_ZOSMR|nr:Ceramidase [Zostera marina]